MNVSYDCCVIGPDESKSESRIIYFSDIHLRQSSHVYISRPKELEPIIDLVKLRWTCVHSLPTYPLAATNIFNNLINP